MAIKINLMPEKTKNDWQKSASTSSAFYSLSVAFFIISVFVFGGTFFYKNYYLQKQSDDLQFKNESLTQEISKTFEQNFILTNKKAKNTKELLSNHFYWSKFFQILENYSLKNIIYSGLTTDAGAANKGSINVMIDGQADDFKTLSKQLAVFRKNKDFSNLSFGGAELDKDGKVSFSIGLNFAPDLIRFEEEGGVKQ